MTRNLAGSRKPHAVDMPVRKAMAQRLAQGVQTERLPRDISVQSQREDERLILGLADHDFELIDDHVGEFARAMAAMQ